MTYEQHVQAKSHCLALARLNLLGRTRLIGALGEWRYPAFPRRCYLKHAYRRISLALPYQLGSVAVNAVCLLAFV